MGAATSEGTGSGSAVGRLGGYSLDKLHYVLKPAGIGSSVKEVNSRMQLVDNFAEGIIAPPKIASIDAVEGIIYFDNPSGLQIEVYKYSRRQRGEHIRSSDGRVYPDRGGKRYKPHVMLKYGETQWTVPDRWIAPLLLEGSRPNRRHYFKFGVRTLAGDRSDLTTLTVVTANEHEYSQLTRILLQGQGGAGGTV